MEQDLPVLLAQIVGCVWSADILLDAAGWIAKEEALESLSRRGFVDWSIVESLPVQFDIGRRSAKDGLDNLFAGFNASPNSLDRQVQLSKLV